VAYNDLTQYTRGFVRLTSGTTVVSTGPIRVKRVVITHSTGTTRTTIFEDATGAAEIMRTINTSREIDVINHGFYCPDGLRVIVPGGTVVTVFYFDA
jgi:hypothetical protein